MSAAFAAYPLTAHANDDLGMSVVITSEVNDQGLTEGNDSLWFGVEPGETVTRTIVVTSESEIDQVIAVELFDFGLENGERFTDFSKPSVVSDWFGFANEEVLLPAGETVEIALDFEVPPEAEEISYEGTARILASAAVLPDGGEDGSNFRAVVGGRAAIDIPFWLGVGDALSFVPEFDILSIQGVLVDDVRYLRVFVENTGTIPVRLLGSAQFADPVFVERVFEPFQFRIPEIGIDQTRFVDVEIDQEITDGDWNVLVALAQGPIRQTKLFEQNLTFTDPSAPRNWGGLALQAAAFIGFLVLAIVGYRLLRTPKRPQYAKSENSVEIARNPKKTIRSIGNSVSDISTLAKEKSKELRTRVQKQQDQSREKTILRLKKRLKRLEDKQFDRKMEGMKLSTTFPSSISANSFGASSSRQETGYSKTDEIFSSMVEEMATVGASTEPTEKPSSSSTERQPARTTAKKATTSTRAQAKPAAKTSSTKKPSQPASRKASGTTTKKTATKTGSQTKASTKTTAAKKPQAKSAPAKKPATGASKSTSTRSTGSRTKKS